MRVSSQVHKLPRIQVTELWGHVSYRLPRLISSNIDSRADEWRGRRVAYSAVKAEIALKSARSERYSC
jgi:hypothetical protein